MTSLLVFWKRRSTPDARCKGGVVGIEALGAPVHEEPTEGAARRAWLEPGGAGRASRRFPPERQRHRDRQVRPQSPARLQDRSPVRPPDRGDLRGGTTTARGTTT